VTGIIQLAAAILLALGASWLTWRLWWTGRAGLRIMGALTGLLSLVLVAVSLAGLLGVYRLAAPQSGTLVAVPTQVNADQLVVGMRRANGCAACHSSNGNLPLDGGSENLLASNGSSLGTLVGPNLTSGGPLKDWSDAEIVRAIREGVDRDGRALLIMPSDAFHHMTDADVGTLVGYLRSQPAVERATPPRDVNLLGLTLIGVGVFPTAAQPHLDAPQTAPPTAISADYGKYLVDISACASCHGQDLHGRAPGSAGPPPGPNLAAIVPGWLEGDFVRFFRTGVDPSGRTINPVLMPWQSIGGSYTDDELRAMYAYLRQLN
jgi:mono/diheme cytochrome c family protein